VKVARFPDRGITPDECRSARALIRWQQIELAERAGVPLETVEIFEAGGDAEPGLAARLRRTFERQTLRFREPGLASGMTLDGMAHNSRTVEGLPTMLSPETPPAAECRLLYPPLGRDANADSVLPATGAE
jgi:hypothetical protein